MMPPWSCPSHGAPLARRGDALDCPSGHAFPVVAEIPRFVAGEAYAEAFGLQWRRYRQTQLDSYSKTTITHDRLRRCLGQELWASLEGKTVLECGCGAGRFTEILLERGARVTSVDLSTAVDANAENFPVGESHRIAQADILRLPFAPEQYDVVLCLGVIQHTPSPEETIASLAAQVKPGGWLVIDHYTRSWSWYLKTAPLLRQILRRLPAEGGLRWTERLVRWFLPLHRAARRSLPLHVLVTRVSPVFSYYRIHPELGDDLQREWALLDTHDGLTDYYKHFRSRRELVDALLANGLEEIWCERGGNGYEARARKKRTLP